MFFVWTSLMGSGNKAVWQRQSFSTIHRLPSPCRCRCIIKNSPTRAEGWCLRQVASSIAVQQASLYCSNWKTKRLRDTRWILFEHSALCRLADIWRIYRHTLLKNKKERERDRRRIASRAPEKTQHFLCHVYIQAGDMTRRHPWLFFRHPFYQHLSSINVYSLRIAILSNFLSLVGELFLFKHRQPSLRAASDIDES